MASDNTNLKEVLEDTFERLYPAKAEEPPPPLEAIPTDGSMIPTPTINIPYHTGSGFSVTSIFPSTTPSIVAPSSTVFIAPLDDRKVMVRDYRSGCDIPLKDYVRGSHNDAPRDTEIYVRDSFCGCVCTLQSYVQMMIDRAIAARVKSEARNH